MKFHLKEYADIKQSVQAMSVRELLGYVTCPHLAPSAPDGVRFRNTAASFFFPCKGEESTKCAEQVNGGRTDGGALIVSDMEFGAAAVLPDATPFPSMMAVARTGDETVAYQMGKIAAEESLPVGFHWTFGPCVDILGNHNNPIVSYRCAGDTMEDNLRFGGAYVRGLQEHGMIATPKHFPGDGYADNDQHLSISVNPLSREEWDASFGKLYSSLIEMGAKSIMIGHIALPAYDEFDEELDVYPPATLSRGLMTGLLKEKLGFEGIIISDALTMGGFCGCMNQYRGCSRFLESGGDCLLFQWPDERYLDEMEKCVERGDLTMETLRNRAYRMLCFGRQYHEEMQNHTPDMPFTPEEKEAIARKVVDSACVIGRDRAHQLPLKLGRDARILHLIVTCEDYDKEAPAAMTEALKARFDHVDELNDPGPWKIKDLVLSGTYDQIICTIGNRLSFGTDTCRLTGPVARNLMEGWMRYDTPVVFVNFGHPYLQDDYRAMIDTIINTYGYCSYTVEYVMKRLFGE